MAQIFIPPAPARSNQNDLNGLIQGLQAGQSIQQMPQQLQNNQINQMLQQALLREKLLDLQDPNRAIARQLQGQLAAQAATPGTGFIYDPAASQAASVLGPIAQPGTVDVNETTGKITQATPRQESLQGIMAGSTPSGFVFNPAIPRAVKSQANIDEALQKGREASAARVPVQFTNGTQTLWVKPGDEIPQGFYNPAFPPTSNKLTNVGKDDVIIDSTGKVIYDSRGGGQGQDAASAYSQERSIRTLNDIAELRQKVSPYTVGVGSLAKYIPATDSANFDADLQSLAANIAFNELNEMRAASKTGGALGQVAVKELELLKSALGGLDSKQSPSNFLKNLDKIEASINRFNASKASRQSPTASIPSDKVMIIAPDGKEGLFPKNRPIPQGYKLK